HRDPHSFPTRRSSDLVSPEDFDWESFESGLDEDDRKEKAQLEKMYDETLDDLDENAVFKGKVVRLTDKEAIVDINFKSEGVISLDRKSTRLNSSHVKI